MKRIMMALACAGLSACASSALMVDQAPSVTYRAATATLVYQPATIAVEENTQAYLQREMQKVLIDGPNAPFKSGNELTVRYQFVGHNEGSRVGRWLTYGLAGGSKTYIQAEFIDPQGQTVGRVRSEGSVGLGIAGGSAKSGIDGAVKEIARYATATFKR